MKKRTQIVKLKTNSRAPRTRQSRLSPVRRVKGKPAKVEKPAAPTTLPTLVLDPIPRATIAPVERSQPAPVRQYAETESAFHLYLREIGETALLTPQEEVSLSKKIRKGDAAARERMIKANLRLVVKIARDYEGLGLPLLDLINEGNIGLMKGVERFDPKKGAKLSTYAAWWIKQSIKRALANQSKTIRLPVHVVDKLLHLRRAEAKLHDVLGREPTDEELGHILGFTAKRVADLRKAAIRPASLEAPLGDDDGKQVADVVADEKAADPYEQLEDKTNTAMIREMVATLSPREAEILRFRFGLDGEEEKTLEEVGEKFGVTRERIRQIQEIALKKLRRKIEKLETVRAAA
jgi:RNA polymerase primary sigma factor